MRPILLLLFALAHVSASDYCKIVVRDAQTGRGVPMVELRTTNERSFYTDSNGIVAFNEPGLMDRDVYFRIASPGYLAFGQVLKTVRGATVPLRIWRINIAERLYRITGQGIYRDSILTGEPTPLKKPVLNADVMGQDTVKAVPYRGKIYWFYGDTNQVAGPLGHFGTAGAVSDLPGNGGLDPSNGIDLNYFIGARGFSAPVLAIPGPGMKWMFWTAVLPDAQGRPRLIARYRSMKSLGEMIEGGLAIFNDQKQRFEPLASLPDFDPHIPIDPFPISSGPAEYLYFSAPLPFLRVPANLDSLKNTANYEGFTCLHPGSNPPAAEVERDRDGRPIYSWHKGVMPLTLEQEKQLIAAGKLKPDEALYQLRDVLSGAIIKPHVSSTYWNNFRQRWIAIIEQDGGFVDNGEIWYAEADTPAGPWIYARKIATHPHYNFYNPAHHPFFDQENGRRIYFEGTYTDAFSDAPVKTPAYNYNQIMYRLTLDDRRLFLPVPVYRTRDGRYVIREAIDSAGLWNDIQDVPFFALPPNRRLPSTIPLSGFSALPLEPDATVTGLWRCTLRENGKVTDEFDMDLLQHDRAVSGTATFGVIRQGTIRQAELTLRIEDGSPAYLVFSAKIAPGRLTGRVTEQGQPGDSPCDCTPAIPQPHNSPDLITLYRYHDGARTQYTTDPLTPSASAVGKVWRNPMSVLVLDRAARPKP